VRSIFFSRSRPLLIFSSPPFLENFWQALSIWVVWSRPSERRDEIDRFLHRDRPAFVPGLRETSRRNLRKAQFPPPLSPLLPSPTLFTVSVVLSFFPRQNFGPLRAPLKEQWTFPEFPLLERKIALFSFPLSRLFPFRYAPSLPFFSCSFKMARPRSFP